MMELLTAAVYVLLIPVLISMIAVILLKVKEYLGRLPRKSGGFVAPGWSQVEDIFKKHLDRGQERGGILSVYHEGELVVHLWGGYADKEALVPWEENTLSTYASVTKATGAIVMQMLVERGLMDMEALVTDYWPEFAQHGKSEVTVEQLLSHQAGLAVIDEEFSFYDALRDIERVGNVLAGQKPNWEPGTDAGYHGTTMGLLMDQLVRKLDPKHRSLSTFFHEEIAKPFVIDFFIGLPKDQHYRKARIHDVALSSCDILKAPTYWKLFYTYLFHQKSLFVRCQKNPTPMDDMENNPSWQEVPTASCNGFGTGSSIAKLMGILANGGNYADQQLLGDSSLQRLGNVLVNTEDLVLLRTTSYGPGTVIRKAPHGGTIFGHYGSGGQVGWADPTTKLGWSYLTNYHTIYALGDSPRILELEKAMYDCVLATNKKR